MTISLQHIDKDLFGSKLRFHIAELKRDNTHSDLFEEIYQLCCLPLEEITKDIEFSELINSQHLKECNNIEVVARWKEYLFKYGDKDKKQHLIDSVNLFLDIFKKQSNHKYLIHALSLVRLAKGIFKNGIDSIYQKSKEAIINLEYPAIQKQIINELISICPQYVKSDFEVFLYARIEEKQKQHDYSSVEHLIESLFLIKSFGATKRKVLLAENYEKEGDWHISNKKENTYYPTILLTYEKALRLLKGIDCEENFRKRIEKKVIKEQKEHVKMHAAFSKSDFGISETQHRVINEFGDSFIKSYGINDFSTGFNALLSVPSDLFAQYIDQQTSDKSTFSSFFSGSSRIDGKGKTVGRTSTEKSEEIFARGLFRECLINAIIKTKWIMNEDKEISKNLVYYFLFNKCNNQIIPENRKIIFAEGIFSGFQNNYILASHLLLPQIENSIKLLAEKCDLLTAKLYEDLQHDNTLGGILDKLINISDSEFLKELKDFLVETNSVNFRNEVAHGIYEPSQIDYYGIYLWWLSLKLIADNDKIFEDLISTTANNV